MHIKPYRIFIITYNVLQHYYDTRCSPKSRSSLLTSLLAENGLRQRTCKGTQVLRRKTQLSCIMGNGGARFLHRRRMLGTKKDDDFSFIALIFSLAIESPTILKGSNAESVQELFKCVTATKKCHYLMLKCGGGFSLQLNLFFIVN